MNKAVIAQINADMGKGAAHGVEKHQIARLQFGLGEDSGGFADGHAGAR